ncbi:MAG: hypothetical protein WBP41_14680 [Saprospiraceae bacterium]
MESSIWNCNLFRFDSRTLQFLRKEGFHNSSEVRKVIVLGEVEYHSIIFEIEVGNIRISISKMGVIFLFVDNLMRAYRWFLVTRLEEFLEAYGEILEFIEKGEENNV